MAKGIKSFYEEKWQQLIVFEGDGKKRSRSPNDLSRFAKIKRLTTFLDMDMLDPFPEFHKQWFCETLFKMAYINEPDVNAIYEENYPGLLPGIIF